MLIKESTTILIQLVLAISLSACTGHSAQRRMATQMPSDWSISTLDKPNGCMPIDDEFYTKGIGNFGQGLELVQSRLDADLGYAYPTHKMPESVKISTNQSARKLTIHFGTPVEKSISVELSCNDGWWKFIQQVSNQYTGDGGKIDELIGTIMIAKSSDDALIVHVQINVVNSSLVIVKQHDYRESWAKYERVSGP